MAEKVAHEEDVIAFIESLPAAALARTWPLASGGFGATVDCGADPYVYDAAPALRGRTYEAACESVKEWLLDDARRGGRYEDRKCQPHWDKCDMLYRLGKYWKRKATMLDDATRPAVSLPGVWRDVDAGRFVKDYNNGDALIEAILEDGFLDLCAKRKCNDGGLFPRFEKCGRKQVLITDAGEIERALDELEKGLCRWIAWRNASETAWRGFAKV